MKTIYSLLFLVLVGITTAQTKLYSPKELKEDANYYFNKLYTVHPDPYYFYPKKEFNQLKKSIYRDLNKPLSKIDFTLSIGRINTYMDTHSTILIPDVIAESLPGIIMDKVKKNILLQLDIVQEQSYAKNPIDYSSIQNLTPEQLDEFITKYNLDKDKLNQALQLLPPVMIRGTDLYFSGDSVNQIIEINGITAESIISEHKKYFNKKLNPNANSADIVTFINGMLIFKINPPFRIKFAQSGKEEVLEGIRVDEWEKKMFNLVEFPGYTAPFAYEIYPSNSIAIFHMNTFDGEYYEEFLRKIEAFKKEVNNQHIKFIFYNLTMNGGGVIHGYEALDVIRHDTTYLKRTETERDKDHNLKLKRVNKVVLSPNLNDSNIPQNRLMFVLQSKYTASGADYFCRLATDNKLGILVGEPTGELTKTFSYSPEFTMPNTHIRFSVATIFVDYSDYFKSLTTEPDIYWDLKNIRESPEQELLHIINYYKKQTELKTRSIISATKK